MTIKRRLLSKIIKTDSCWLWTGYQARGGYGMIGFQGKKQYVHRLIWSLTRKRTIPKGLNILHRCDVPSCVRPSHLFIGSHADNMKDRNNKGRQAKGESQANSKLSDKEVLAIRHRFASEEITISKLARIYNLSPSAIYYVIRGITWKHLPYNKHIPTKYCGSKHHSSKLTKKDVKLIRKRYKSKQIFMKDLSKEFGVSIAAISEIVNFTTWKSVK